MTCGARRLIYACAVAVLAAQSGCGGDPNRPPTMPTATPTPAAVPGGTLRGAYVFRLEPAADCPTPSASFSFFVQATSEDTVRYPGFAVLLDVVPLLELELQYTSPTLRGSIGTTYDGVSANEGTAAASLSLWINAIAIGTVTTGASGVGEVQQGTLTGELAFGRNPGDEGGLGSCVSSGHRWSLRLR